MGNASSPGSSSSASSTSSLCQDNSNSPMRSPDTTTVEDVRDMGDRPYLQILEPPCDKFRFRYKTEMQGTHGTILGLNTQKSRAKTFPRVRLCNFINSRPGEYPIIRCTLYTADEDESKRKPHVHRLVGERAGQEMDDPIDEIVKPQSCSALFPNMTILYTKKEDQIDVLVNKKRRHTKKWFVNDNVTIRTMSEEHLIKAAIDDLKTMNLNLVTLRFDALIDNGQGRYVSVCSPVYSKPISNMKNPQTNELKITRVDRVMGCCDGKEEVFIFVEKVVKKNIKVKFYDDDEMDPWWDYAEFSMDDVHHQYGIVFKTPPYKNLDITENVVCHFQLERPSDGAVSAPITFEYKPNFDRIRHISRKRPRRDDDLLYPVTLKNYERPSYPLFTSPVKPVLPDCSTQDQDLSFSIFSANDDLLLDLWQDIETDPEIQQAMNVETEPSFTDILDNLPSADSDALSLLLSSGRLKEYAGIIGETEGAEQLICGGLNATQPEMEPEELVPDGLMFSGRKKSSNEGEMGPVRFQGPSEEIPYAQGEDYPSHYRATQRISPIQRLNAKLKSINIDYPTAYHQSAGPVDERKKVKLDETTIVDSTENTVDNLTEMVRKKRMSEKVVRKFLERLFTHYTVGEYEDTVLHILAASESAPPPQAKKFINLLKTYEVEKTVLNLMNNKGESPLHVAARRGNPKMISSLLDAGANINLTDKKNNTAMHLAVLREQGAMEVVEVLLKRRPDLTIFNEDGYTVLHLAVDNRKSDVISSLIVKSEYWTKSSLINLQDRKHGNTPLHIAVSNRFTEVVNLLLNFEEQIVVDTKNFADKTPLALVLGNLDKDSKEIQDRLFTAKADPSLVIIEKEKKEEYKEETEISISDVEVIDDPVEDTMSAYEREWGSSELFDKATISKLCPLLDKFGDWKLLVGKLNYMDSEIEYCERHWSPSLLALKLASEYKPEVTAELIRDHLLLMSPYLQTGAQHIDDMLLQKLGLE